MESMTKAKPAANAKDQAMQLIYNEARIAGLKAVKDLVVTPMIVGGYEPVLDGVCGFAWIVIKPANCAFANWARREGLGRTGYGGGLHIWVGDFDQSYEKKQAYAWAFAEVLRNAGYMAYSDGRLD